MKKLIFLAVAIALVLSPPTFAEDKPGGDSDDQESIQSRIFGTFLLSTTLAYKPNGGDFDGPQKDITAMVGVGYLLTEELAIELDLGPTFSEDGYFAFAFVPGVLWLFHANVYVAARFIIPVDPEINLALFPGIGAALPLDCGLTPFVEAHVLSFIGRGEPDFGMAIDLGVTYLF